MGREERRREGRKMEKMLAMEDRGGVTRVRREMRGDKKKIVQSEITRSSGGKWMKRKWKVGG